jgi:hypothetical protein
MGDWAVVGFLSNSNSGTKADLSKFLKSGESIERTKDILSAACRLVLLLGYIFGPTAYRPWYLELHLTLTEEVPLSTIHPGAFKEFLTSHIKLFLCVGPSNYCHQVAQRKRRHRSRVRNSAPKDLPSSHTEPSEQFDYENSPSILSTKGATSTNKGNYDCTSYSALGIQEFCRPNP